MMKRNKNFPLLHEYVCVYKERAGHWNETGEKVKVYAVTDENGKIIGQDIYYFPVVGKKRKITGKEWYQLQYKQYWDDVYDDK